LHYSFAGNLKFNPQTTRNQAIWQMHANSLEFIPHNRRRKWVPTKFELRANAEVRRCRRLLHVTAALSSIGDQQAIISSSALLALWHIRHREFRRARGLRVLMFSRRFSLREMSSHDVVSQMRFCKRDMTYLSFRIPWREVTMFGQVRTARCRLCFI
jgi:hypothetical protein